MFVAVDVEGITWELQNKRLICLTFFVILYGLRSPNK